MKEVTEGDWLAKDVIVSGEKVRLRRTLEKKDIITLHELFKKNKLKHIMIKIGIPFVPSFLFAYLTVLFGSGIFVWVSSFIV